MAANALGRAALVSSALFAATAFAQSRLPSDWYLDPRTAPVARGAPVPDFGERSGDHMLPPAEAALRCTETAQRNLADLGKYYEGVLELAPPDEYLVCLVKRVKGLINRSDLPSRRLNSVEVATFGFEGVSDSHDAPAVESTAGAETTVVQNLVFFFSPKVPAGAMPLVRQIERLDGGSGYVWELDRADKRLRLLRPMQQARTSLASKLEAMKTLMRNGELWPKASEFAELVWPHAACLKATDGVEGFNRRRDQAISSRPLAAAFAFYEDFEAFVEAYGRYKDSDWYPSRDEALALFLGNCSPTKVHAMLRPFYVELRPEISARGRRPLQAFQDIEAAQAALDSLGVDLDEEVKGLEATRAQALADIKRLTTELRPRVQLELDAAQKAFDLIARSKDPHQIAVERARSLSAELDRLQGERQALLRKQAQTQLLVSNLRVQVAAKLDARNAAREAVATAEEARVGLKLGCGGADYAHCNDPAARLAYDQARYEASQALAAAMGRYRQADATLKSSRDALYKAQEELLTYPDKLLALRDSARQAQDALEKHLEAPVAEKDAHAQAASKSAVELDAWKKLLARVDSAKALAENANR